MSKESKSFFSKSAFSKPAFSKPAFKYSPSEAPRKGSVAFLRKIFETNPPNNAKPVMDTYKKPSLFSTVAQSSPPGSKENWFSKAFKYPFVGNSPEMDELTKNHWSYRRGVSSDLPLIGRLPNGGPLVRRVESSADRFLANYHYFCFAMFALFGLMLFMICRKLGGERCRGLRKKRALAREKAARGHDIERACCVVEVIEE